MINPRKSSIVKDITVIAGGTAGAQLITILFSPIITRLYGPSAFGILGVFTAISAMVVPLANLAYSDAIIIPGSEREAKILVKLCFLITAGISFMFMLVMSLGHTHVDRWMGFDASSLYLLLVPPFIFMDSCEHILRNWLIRKKLFKSISIIAIFHAVALGATKSGLGLFFASAPLLLVLNVVCHLFRLSFSSLVALPTLTKNAVHSFKNLFGQISELKDTAYKYRDFPLYSLPQGLIFSFSENLPVLILGAFFGPASVGYFTLSKRVLMQPFTLIARSIGIAYQPRLAEAANRGEKLQPHIIKATGVLALLGLFPFGLVVAFGPWLFGFVFGSQWIFAGDYARWLSLWLFFDFVNVPCVKAIPIIGLQSYKLGYEVLSSTISIGLLAIGAFYFKNDIWTIALFAIGKAILYIGLIVGVIILSRTHTRFTKDFS